MKQILIVDDNPLTLAWFDEAIRRAGFTPVLAANSGQAVALAIGDAFALMLIDANLPDRSGTATLAEIRSGNGPNRQTVAVLTSADSTIRQSAAHDMGFADVLHKPFALEELRAILDQAMGAGASNRAGISLLDDDQSRRNSGGNDAIAAALRSLFVKELDELPAELDAMAGNADFCALRDRLHRLDASAGIFLPQAGKRWPHLETRWSKTRLSDYARPPAAACSMPGANRHPTGFAATGA